MFGSPGQKARASTATLSNTKLKNWTSVSRDHKKSDGSNYEPDSLRVMTDTSNIMTAKYRFVIDVKRLLRMHTVFVFSTVTK